MSFQPQPLIAGDRIIISDKSLGGVPIVYRALDEQASSHDR